MRNWQATVRPHWMEIVLAAAVVVVAAVVGTVQVYIYIRQAEIMSTQAEIAKSQVPIYKRQADIMSTQAEIARGQLAEMQRQGRAWVSIEPFLGNVTWDKDGVNINMKLTVKNTGKIPALYVVRDARLVPTIAQEDPYNIFRKMTTEKRQGPIDVLGVPLFPNDTLDWFAVFKFSREAITKNFEYMSTFRPVGHPSDEPTLRPEDFRHIGLSLVYFVDYTFGGDNTHHQHSCMCNIHRTLPNTAAGFALPLDEDLSTSSLRLDSYPINCQAD
jgi:hypothetical protein